MSDLLKDITPLPWRISDDYPIPDTAVIEFDAFSSIAEVRHGADGGWDGKPYPGTPQANARYIVQACNAFPVLVEALEAAKETLAFHAEWHGLNGTDESRGHFTRLLAQVKSIDGKLAKAKGEQS